MTGRRAALLAVCLVAGGGLLVVVAAGRVWAGATLPAATGNRVHVSVTGRHVAAALPAMGIALAALAVAIVAARPGLRRAVAAVVVAVAVATCVVAVNAHGDVGTSLAQRAFGVQVSRVHAPVSGWWLAAFSGALCAAVGGVLALLFAAGWRGLGSRYDAPAARRPADVASSTWDAIDRGEDPTD